MLAAANLLNFDVIKRNLRYLLPYLKGKVIRMLVINLRFVDT